MKSNIPNTCILSHAIIEKNKHLIKICTYLKKFFHTLTYYDQLTYLPNRVMFLEDIDRFVTIKKDFAVLLLDMDRFKIINNSINHRLGDLLLKSLSKRLQSCITEFDKIYRIGGDEFAFIIKNVSHLDQITQKIISSISEPFTVEDYPVFVTLSIGAAYYPHDGADTDTLIKNVETAMYQAKSIGKNQFVTYSADMDKGVINQLLAENELRHAIEREELHLDYQPQVDVFTGTIRAAEALIRWHHPKVGLVAPNKFISLAEENGLIIPIGEWVLKTACMQNKSWQAQGYPPIKVAVNISNTQFEQIDFVQIVEKTLKETGLEAKYLELEITENIAMNNIDWVIFVLKQLKELGVSIAIDDFGIGYSSFNYLKKLPIDILKIDRAFINRIPTDKKDEAIVKGIIHMSHCLDLHVIAEGVETEEQFSFLCKCKCDSIQGFLFSKPVKSDFFWSNFRKNSVFFNFKNK